MWFLILKAGILVLSITSVVGRAVSENANEEINIESFEEKSANSCVCEKQYHKHYVAKGCVVEEVDSCGCAKNYFCPQQSETIEDKKACFYQNQEYKVGSRINVTDACQSCRCVGDPPQITCRTKECPELEYSEGINCHLVYAKDQCCPSKYECVSEDYKNEAHTEALFCEHNGITYPLGAKIYSRDDPCLICKCTEDWRGISNSSCYQKDCLFEKHKHLLDRGCTPVYHENKCCPIEFFCPENYNVSRSSLDNNENIKNNENAVPECKFAGVLYKVGSDIPIDNPCIKCSCLTPPDLTCIHKSCHPVSDIELCEVVYSSNECCPSYECVYNGTDGNNSSKIICPTPLCADSSCQIKVPDGHQCPTCVCDESESHEKNIFEPSGEGIMEGPFQNQSSSEIRDPEEESKGFDGWVSIPFESEFDEQNKSKSDNLNEQEQSKFFLEEFDLIPDEDADIFEKESEIPQIEGEHETKPDFIDIESSHESNISLSETDDSVKILRKRSTDFRNNDGDLNQAQQNGIQTDQFMESQQQFFVEEEDEHQHETSVDGDEGYDEIKLSSKNKNKPTAIDGRSSDEDLDGSESIIVPAGCPTPLCANSSCKIEIPIGQQCPTCVCKRRDDWQP